MKKIVGKQEIAIWYANSILNTNDERIIWLIMNLDYDSFDEIWCKYDYEKAY